MELSGTDGATVIRVIDGEVYYVPIEATELDPTTLTIVVWDPDDDNYWEAEDGHSAQKIMFVLWSPEGAKVKDKMMTTGSKDALKKALVGIGQDFQATDASEITYEECLEKAKSAVRLAGLAHSVRRTHYS